MRLIVGLGNPGPRYRDTPHNAGFQVCDCFASRHRMGEERLKFRGRFRRARVLGEDVGVLKPETYMNHSGESVADSVRYLPLEGRDLIVVYDDIDLPLGRIRVRSSGGGGGHLGVQSVIDRLGTKDFPRVRVGVGRPPDERDAAGHVLSRLPADARGRLAEMVERAASALEVILEEGIQEAMNRYNGPLTDGEPGDDETGKEGQA